MNKISKIIWSLFSGVVCLVYKPQNATADWQTVNNNPCVAYYGDDCEGTNFTSSTSAPANCTSSTLYCSHINGITVYREEQCNSCKSGYLLTKTGNLFPQGLCATTSTSQQVYKYECICKCNNCTETGGTWTASGTGYEKRTGQGCDCSSGTATCKTTTFYRCAAGYYGSSTNGTSGCTQCPTPGTSNAGATTLSSCYIPKGTYSDTTGKYAFNCDCPYNGKNSCGSSSSSSAA